MTRRIHHAVYLFPADELPAAKAFWEEALGVPMEEVTFNPNLSIFHAPEAGIELVAPVPGAEAVPAGMIRFLERGGAGLFTLVFEVDDLDQSLAGVDAKGVEVKRRLDFEAATQVELDEHHGMRVTLRYPRHGGA